MKKRYDSYKPSGIDWIGDIPSHWVSKRLRYVCEFRNGYTPSKANGDYWSEGTIPWYRMEDIRESGRFLKESKQYVSTEAVKGGGLFEAGSFILATTATIGEHAMLIVDSLANQRFTNLKIRKSLSHTVTKEFFFYYLFVIDEFCKSTTKTTTFPAMDMTDLRNLGVSIPPLAEQEAIAAWLDEKCEDIDAAIAKVDREIELIDELKQSEISRVVTRGLNPDTPLRPSDIDWIGNIPEHWAIRKVAQIFHGIGSGTTPTSGSNKYYSEDGVNWLQTGDLNDGNINDTSKKITTTALTDFSSLKIYPKGSIVIAMYGATIGKLGKLNIETTTNQACCVLPKSNEIDNDFAFYVFWAGKRALINSAYGGGQPNISQDTIKSFKFALPPLSEQQAIADYLDKKCAVIDGLKAKLTKKRETLTELRQSIISEVVTGKRKII